MNESHIPKQICLYCGYKQDTSSSVFKEGESKPRPGDFSVCLNCANVAVFGEDLIQRLPTPEEKEMIGKNRQILHSQWAIFCVDKPDLRKRNYENDQQ